MCRALQIDLFIIDRTQSLNLTHLLHESNKINTAMKKTRHNFEKKWKERFEGYASNADDDAGIAGRSPTGLDDRLRQFINICGSNILKENFWLDAGCGAGTYSRFIASQGANVIGLDYSFPSLQKAMLKV